MGALSDGMVILDSIDQHDPKSVLDVEKTYRIRLERHLHRRSPTVTSRYRGGRR